MYSYAKVQGFFMHRDMIRVNLSHIKIWPPYFHSRLCNYVFSIVLDQ